MPPTRLKPNVMEYARLLCGFAQISADSQPFPEQEFSYYLLHILLLAINGVIELPHLRVGNFASKFIERLANLGVFAQRLLTNHPHRLIRRKILLVVVEYKQIERGDQPVRHISRNKVDLAI